MLKAPDMSKPEGLRDRELVVFSGMRFEVVSMAHERQARHAPGDATDLRTSDRGQGKAHSHNIYFPAGGSMDPQLSR